MDFSDVVAFMTDRPFWAFMTAIASAVGFVVAALLGAELKGSDSITKARLASLYFADAFSFFILFIFSLASLIDFYGYNATVFFAFGRPLRFVVVLLVVVALIRFFRHIRRLKEADKDG